MRGDSRPRGLPRSLGSLRNARIPVVAERDDQRLRQHDGRRQGPEAVHLSVAHHKVQAGVAGERTRHGIGDGEHGHLADMGVGDDVHHRLGVLGEAHGDEQVVGTDGRHLLGQHSADRIQQVAQLGLGESMAWINNQQDWPDVYGLPLDNLFGVFGTTWYWKLDLPGVPEFVQRYQAAYPDTKMRVPGNVFYNGYMATRELLGAVERAGSTNNGKVIQELEGLKISAGDRMQHHDAYMNPATHQMQQTIYLATANQGTQDPDDMFKVLSESDPEEIRDTGADAACKMESLDDTPTYEM